MSTFGAPQAVLFITMSELDEGARERLAAIGEIAAEVAHELRNVLQIIASTAWLAKSDPARSLAHIVKIERNARLAFGIVDDLMALARGEATAASPVLGAEILANARVGIDPDRAVWRDVLEPPDLGFRAHPGLLSRAIHALYENAIQACGSRAPVITTRAWRAGGRVVLEVSDDGPGVPAAIAPRIFEPLVTGRAGGSGLGLAMTRRIVAAHGGRIALVEPRSGEPGGGSATGATFRIEWAG